MNKYQREIWMDNFSDFIARIADAQLISDSASHNEDISTHVTFVTGDAVCSPVTRQQTHPSNADGQFCGAVDINVPRSDDFLNKTKPLFEEYMKGGPNEFSSLGKRKAALYALANKDEQWRYPPLLPFANLAYYSNLPADTPIPEAVIPVLTLDDLHDQVFQRSSSFSPRNRLLIDSRAICHILKVKTPQDDMARFSALVYALYSGTHKFPTVCLVDVAATARYDMITGQSATITAGDRERAYNYLQSTLPFDDFALGIFFYNPYQGSDSFYHSAIDSQPREAKTLTYKVPHYDFVDHFLYHGCHQSYHPCMNLNNLAFDLRVVRLLCQQIAKYSLGWGVVPGIGKQDYRDINLDPFVTFSFDATMPVDMSLDFIPFDFIKYYRGNHPEFAKIRTPWSCKTRTYDITPLEPTYVRGSDGVFHLCTFLKEEKPTLSVSSYAMAEKKSYTVNYFDPFGRTVEVNFPGNRIVSAHPCFFNYSQGRCGLATWAAEIPFTLPHQWLFFQGGPIAWMEDNQVDFDPLNC